MLGSQFIGFVGLVAVAACWGLAIIVYRGRATSSIARRLSVLLLIEGVVLITAGFPQFALGAPMSFWADFNDAHPLVYLSLSLAHHLGDAAMIALYPPFLALALDSRLTRPFADRQVQIVLAVGAFVFALAVVFTESRIVVTLFYLAVTFLFIYALIASIHAWRTATTGIVRERARIFALAFGARDIGWGMSYAIAAWGMWTLPDPYAMTDMRWFGKFVYAAGTLVAVPLIAYGILRTQLFDIDLRIRWTIRQSTVAAVFVAIFYLVSEGADRVLSSELGNIAGLLASALVVFFLAPLQRFADRLAGAAMPNTENTPEYVAFRKMQVYEAALVDALPDGRITERERSLLNRLRESLDISIADAEAIERGLKKDRTTTT